MGDREIRVGDIVRYQGREWQVVGNAGRSLALERQARGASVCDSAREDEVDLVGEQIGFLESRITQEESRE